MKAKEGGKRNEKIIETLLPRRTTASVVSAWQMFTLKWQSPLVAVGIMTGAKEEVK